MNYAERLVLASLMVTTSKQVRAEGLDTYKGDREMSAVVRQDANDLREVGRLLRTKGVDAARNFADNLDTNVREQIPEEVWNALQGNDEDDEAQDDLMFLVRQKELLERQAKLLESRIAKARRRVGA